VATGSKEAGLFPDSVLAVRAGDSTVLAVAVGEWVLWEFGDDTRTCNAARI
jgi:hypothetical protein